MAPAATSSATLRPDPLLAHGRVDRALARDADVDVHPVLGGLALGNPEEADGRPRAVGVDDRGTVGLVVARFRDVAERERPERREPVGVRGVAAERPVGGHAAIVGAGTNRGPPVRTGAAVAAPEAAVGPRSYGGGMVRPITDLQRTVAPFEVISDFVPSGDQPTAIADLARRIEAGEQDVVLLGATGTGKSATTAWLVEKLQRPTLVMAPNKTLAAQLANEFRELLPNNAVEYFVSYYDYYQPEAYIPQTDTYIEKDSSVNEEVERLRHSATNSLLTRRDVIVVASRVLHLRPRHPAGVRRPHGAAQGRPGVGPRRPAAPPRLDPVHPQRPRLHPRHVPGPRRHDRGVPRLRGAPGADRDVRRRGRAPHDPAPGHRRDPHRGHRALHLPGHALRRRSRSGWSARSPASRPSSRSGSRRWSARASCSRPSGCACAPPTTWR